MIKETNKENTLTIQCYEQMQNDIINGTFLPGQKLKIDFLKQRLNAGQSPIREALSRLVASGLVEVEDNKGFRVAKISELDIRDIYQTFYHIEILALKLAMERGDDAWEAGIVAAFHQLALVEIKKETVDYCIWSERNYAFHVALISGCKSPLLLQIREDIYRRFDRYCHIAFNISQEKLELNHNEHKKIAQAILQRNKKDTIALIKHHILGALEDVIRSLRKNNML